MFNKKFGLVLGAALLAAPLAVNAAEAPKAFKACSPACHQVVAGKHGVGPSLFGVVGRKAGTADGFKYSPSMAAAGFVWDDAKLAAYIADPKTTVPGNKMTYAGLKDPAAVKEVIDYLKTLK